MADTLGKPEISTLFGIQTAQQPFLKGTADLYRVQLRCGSEVVVTDGHRFLTPDGWLPLSRLRPGSLVAIGGASSEVWGSETGRDWPGNCLSGLRLDDELPNPQAVAFLEMLRQLGSTRSGDGCLHTALAPGRLQGASVSAWSEIKSIKWDRFGEYWDLHVPGHNHYSAQGIFHHNSGKTKIGCIDIARRAQPGEPWMAVSPDNNMIRDTTLPSFIETVQFSGQYLDHVLSPTPKVWFKTIYGGKAELIFKGAEKPDKLRGPNKAGLWFDEASIISEDAFQLAIAVCRFRGKMGPVRCTFTPRGFKHWTFEKFYDRIDDELIPLHPDAKIIQGRGYIPRPETRLIHCRSADNPFAPAEYVRRIGANYSSMLALQELEGEFIDISGLLFKREWFTGRFIDKVPQDCARVRFWDKAASASSDSCYTVGLLMARDKWGIEYVEDIVRGQWSAHTRNEIMLHTAERDYRRYGGSVLTYIEQEGGGDGKSVADDLIRMLGRYPVFRQMSGGGQWKTKGAVRLPGDTKIRRALPFAAQCEAGNVRVLNGKFANDFVDELVHFPEYAVCDQVDAAAYAHLRLANMPLEDLYASRDVVTKESTSYGETVELEMDSVARWEDLPWNRQL